MKLVRHHLLEIILWPNTDGTFRIIRNSAKRLQELGIYDEYKLTLQMTRAEHASLHHKGLQHSIEHCRNISAAKQGKSHKHHSYETCRKISEGLKGANNPFYGKHHSDETRRKISESLKNKPGNHHTDASKQKLSTLWKGKHWKLVDGKRVWY